MTYDETKDEVFRIIKAVERREFLKMLAFRGTVVAVAFLFLAFTFRVVARQSTADDTDLGAELKRREIYLQQVEHAYAVMAKVEAAKTDKDKADLLNGELTWAIQAIINRK